MYPGRKFRLCGCVLFSILAGFVFQELEAATPEVTIDPRVWQDVENGGTGHFLILLREQSDSKAAAKGVANRNAGRDDFGRREHWPHSSDQSLGVGLYRAGNRLCECGHRRAMESSGFALALSRLERDERRS